MKTIETTFGMRIPDTFTRSWAAFRTPSSCSRDPPMPICSTTRQEVSAVQGLVVPGSLCNYGYSFRNKHGTNKSLLVHKLEQQTCSQNDNLVICWDRLLILDPAHYVRAVIGVS